MMKVEKWPLFITLIGFSLCLGSIVAFISMNILKDSSTTELIFWQRKFINGIMNIATIPGLLLFLIGNIGLYYFSKCKREKWVIFRLIIPAIITMNGLMFIVPLANKVNEIAFHQYKTSTILTEFTSLKSIEDTLGGLNLLLLLFYLIIICFSIYSIKLEK